MHVINRTPRYLSTMDFSQVRLADFAASSLRAAGSHATPQSSVAPQLPEKCASEVSEVCARAPQYSVDLYKTRPELHGARVLERCAESKYTLAQSDTALHVWRSGSARVLSFPTAANTKALFVPPVVAQTQPGLAVVSADGDISVWESLNKAATDIDRENQKSARIPLSNEVIEFVEPVFPTGFVVSTSRNKFFLVTVRDDLQKFSLRVLRFDEPQFSLTNLFKSGLNGQIAAVKAGNPVPNSSDRELFVANVHGDVAQWRVGLNAATHVRSAAVGSLIHSHTNQLYPHSGLSLRVHGIAATDGYCHVLASFAPQRDSAHRMLVVASLNADFELVCCRRLQTKQLNAAGDAGIRACGETLAVYTRGSVTMLEGPRADLDAARWEETVQFKRWVQITACAEDALALSFAHGYFVMRIDDAAVQRGLNVLKTRLELAVFFASPENPLDLTEWPEFAFGENSNAIAELASEIANSTSPYLPAPSADLEPHFRARVSALHRLYAHTTSADTRDALQTVVAAAALYKQYISTELAGAGFESREEARRFFLHGMSTVPAVFARLAADPACHDAVVTCLAACAASDLPLPKWARFERVIERVALTRADSADPADLTALLRLVLLTKPGSDELTSKLFAKLLELGGESSVRAIAREFSVFSTLTPLETRLWLQTGDTSSLSSLLASKEFADSFFSYCVAHNLVQPLVAAFKSTHAGLLARWFLDAGLPQFAWTLDPSSAASVSMLEQAALNARNLASRKLLASLYKLSAHCCRVPLNKAQDLLDLCAAQDLLQVQYKDAASASQIVNNALPELSKLLTPASAVELLALAPVQEVVETNVNFVLGFQLVNLLDTVRVRLLVQQLVCATDWEHADGATLFTRTYGLVSSSVQAVLRDLAFWLAPPQPEDVAQTYSWNALPELQKIAGLARSIAEKNDVFSRLP